MRTGYCGSAASSADRSPDDCNYERDRHQNQHQRRSHRTQQHCRYKQSDRDYRERYSGGGGSPSPKPDPRFRRKLWICVTPPGNYDLKSFHTHSAFPEVLHRTAPHWGKTPQVGLMRSDCANAVGKSRTDRIAALTRLHPRPWTRSRIGLHFLDPMHRALAIAGLLSSYKQLSLANSGLVFPRNSKPVIFFA